ncbi:hypothetical protein LOAG_00173 [Loa loa]|uniref:Uncharacterized protein n=1 Tax=Loa loa TaxID=7209 RepID=A0A1S0UBV1_LOALO|nr:hypothetical protein LOAG_00173 [Loa loa]EFO28316.2 hypothetical protein LOAG_00173 [Loa loa]
MSDKEFLESGEQEGICPSYFWYLIGSFGITAIIVVFLIAYLIMYSNHFIWALRRNPKPTIKRKNKNKTSKGSSDKGESTAEGV